MSEKKFLAKYSEFYRKFFTDTADSINQLGEIQEDFKDEYEKVREFYYDSKAIDELIEKLSPEEQGILLKILLKAGNVGKKISNLFEMTPKEKRTFSEELKKFSKELDKNIEILTKNKKR